jgi:hypothetical protein
MADRSCGVAIAGVTHSTSRDPPMTQSPKSAPRRLDPPVVLLLDRFAPGRALQPMLQPATEGRSGGACNRGLFFAGLVLLSPAILLGLLAVFVAWLVVFGLLGAAIVASDLFRGAGWLVRAPFGAIGPRAAGYPAGS